MRKIRFVTAALIFFVSPAIMALNQHPLDPGAIPSCRVLGCHNSVFQELWGIPCPVEHAVIGKVVCCHSHPKDNCFPRGTCIGADEILYCHPHPVVGCVDYGQTTCKFGIWTPPCG